MSRSSEDPTPLPRRPFFGARVRAHEGGGLMVQAVDSRGSAAGVLARGDRLLAVDGAPLACGADLGAALRRAGAGARGRVERERAGAREVLEVDLKDMPLETGYKGHVEVGAITVAGVRLRTLVGVPAGAGPWPGWLLISGSRCRSQEQALTPRSAEAGLLAMFSATGAVTMRIERPGVGDSEGGPCGALGLADDVAIFSAALRTLAARDDVDPGALGILARGGGTFLAPLVAAALPVRGIALHGASGRPWSAVFARLEAARAGGRGTLAVGGRSPAYHRDLDAVDLVAAWAPIAGDVVLLHGARDPIVDEDDVRELAAILERRPRGRCDLEILDALGRRLTLAGLRRLWPVLGGWAERRELLRPDATAGR